MSARTTAQNRDRAIRFAIVALVLLAGYLYSKYKGVGSQSGSTPTSGSSSNAGNRAEEKTPVVRTEPRAEPTAAPSTVAQEPKAPAPEKSEEAGPAAASSVRIGTWNIEWLGKPDDRSGVAKGVAQSADDLADYVIASKVDVLALEEIVSNRPGKPIRSPEIEAMIAKMKERDAGAWEYVLNPGINDGDQLTGVMWNTGKVTALNAKGGAWNSQSDSPMRLNIGKVRSSQSGYLWNRPPHAIKFVVGSPTEKKTDFVLIPIHMKADYQGQFSAHRREEAEALVAQLPAVRKAMSDEDVVILGDSNCPSPSEPALRVLTDAGYLDLNANGKSTHWRGEGSMDRAVVPAKQPEFAGSGTAFTVFADEYQRVKRIDAKEFKRRFSDHYLVYTDVAVMADDD